MKWWFFMLPVALGTFQASAMAGCNPSICEDIAVKTAKCMREGHGRSYNECFRVRMAEVKKHCICPPESDESAPSALEFNALGDNEVGAMSDDDFLCEFCYRRPMIYGCTDVLSNCR